MPKADRVPSTLPTKATSERDDIEKEVNDVADMSNVCNLLVDHLHAQISALKNMGLTGKQTADEAERASEPLAFGVQHLYELVISLKKNYYDALEA